MAGRVRSRAGAMLLAAVLAGCTGSQPGGGGGCEGPHITSVSPEPVSGGQTVTVQGAAFMDGCVDASGVDEDGRVVVAETAAPQRSVEVVWVQGDDRIVLGTADASESGGISVDVTVPASATPGVALIELGPWAEPIEVEVR